MKLTETEAWDIGSVAGKKGVGVDNGTHFLGLIMGFFRVDHGVKA